MGHIRQIKTVTNESSYCLLGNTVIGYGVTSKTVLIAAAILFRRSSLSSLEFDLESSVKFSSDNFDFFSKSNSSIDSDRFLVLNRLILSLRQIISSKATRQRLRAIKSQLILILIIELAAEFGK